MVGDERHSSLGSPPYMKARAKLYRYLLAASSCLFALFLAEVACRIFFSPSPTLRFKQDIDELRGMKLDEATQIIRNDAELFWQLAPQTTLPANAWPFFGVVANGQSLREDHEIPLQKPAGETRILFLGDSCTFGYGVAYDKTFVKVAQSLLQQRADGPVRCINAGVPGYTLFQGYRRLATQGLSLQPDLVVLNFGWNDYGVWDDLGDREHYDQAQAGEPPGLLRHSRVARLLWSAGRSRITTDGASKERRPRLLPEEFLETLEKIHDLTQARQIPLLILVWPMRDNTRSDVPPTLRSPLQVEMIAFGQAHPLSMSARVSGVLDLVPLGRKLVEEHGAPAIYLDHGHVTEAGHQAIGQAIADHLAPWLKKE